MFSMILAAPEQSGKSVLHSLWQLLCKLHRKAVSQGKASSKLCIRLRGMTRVFLEFGPGLLSHNPHRIRKQEPGKILMVTMYPAEG